MYERQESFTNLRSQNFQGDHESKFYSRRPVLQVRPSNDHSLGTNSRAEYGSDNPVTDQQANSKSHARYNPRQTGTNQFGSPAIGNHCGDYYGGYGPQTGQNYQYGNPGMLPQYRNLSMGNQNNSHQVGINQNSSPAVGNQLGNGYFSNQAGFNNQSVPFNSPAMGYNNQQPIIDVPVQDAFLMTCAARILASNSITAQSVGGGYGYRSPPRHVGTESRHPEQDRRRSASPQRQPNAAQSRRRRRRNGRGRGTHH